MRSIMCLAGCSCCSIKESKEKTSVGGSGAVQLGFQKRGSFPEMGGSQQAFQGKESSWHSSLPGHASFRQEKFPRRAIPATHSRQLSKSADSVCAASPSRHTT